MDLEQALAQMLTSHSAFMNETKANMQQQATQLNNQEVQLRNLEVQMGQMANLLTERQPGSLPSNSEVNPRRDGNEHVKAVMLRSGKELEAKGQSPVIEEVETEKVIRPVRMMMKIRNSLTRSNQKRTLLKQRLVCQFLTHNVSRSINWISNSLNSWMCSKSYTSISRLLMP